MPSFQWLKWLTLLLSISSVSLTILFYLLTTDNDIHTLSVYTQQSEVHDDDIVHIVMIGDSITRYQYVSLCELIKYGSDALYPFYEHHHSNWKLFYQNSTNYLSEISCDCYRVKHEHPCCTHPFVMENRYFRFRKFHLTYFMWFGDVNYPYGHWKPSDGYPITQPCNPGELCHIQHSARWSYDRKMNEFIADIVMQLEPKPNFVFMNTGLWDRHNVFPNQELKTLFNFINSTQNNCATQFIWSTTTLKNDETIQQSNRDELSRISLAKAYGLRIFDLRNISSKIEPKYYYDDMHFKEEVNKMFNRELLSFINVHI
eukprot:78008_1